MSAQPAFEEHELLREIPHLRRYARTLSRSPEEGDDLTQSALERALARQHQFEPKTELRRWLFTIARHAHIDECRRTQRRGTCLSLDETHLEPKTDGGQLHHVQLRELERQMDGLRDEEQSVLRLSVFAGLSHAEIADRMDTAVGTVKSRLSRARHTLADASGAQPDR